jgi:uncharacterized membrane protein YphA (DoxX/SURF4 family)
MWQRLKNIFHAQVHIAPLVTFRILFGILMMAGTARFMQLGWIDDHYINPVFHFKYFGFEWVKPLGKTGMYAVHIILLVASLLVTLGLFYRIAAIVVFICFSYTELIDLTYYLNHYYFLSLVSFLLILVPANRYFSIDVVRKPNLFCNTVPGWCINIFKLQLAIVYVFAGLIKINYDWLINALPMKIWLPANDTVPALGKLFAWQYSPHLFSWVGMLYDTTIIFWLLWKKSRPWAYVTVIVFHTLVGILFQIGVFPLVMIGATLIFFSDKWHNNLHSLLAKCLHKKQLYVLQRKELHNYRPAAWAKKTMIGFLSVYFFIQLLFPWRYLLYPGNMYWTEQGYRFGWRVMLMEKAGTATFYVKDSKTGREGEVFNMEFLNPHQEKQMAMQPDMILQYAHFLGNYYEAKGIYKPQVRAEVFVTLNARPSQLYIDSTVNLMTIKDGWRHKWWVKEYKTK